MEEKINLISAVIVAPIDKSGRVVIPLTVRKRTYHIDNDECIKLIFTGDGFLVRKLLDGESSKKRIDANGRITLPAKQRKRLGMMAGDVLTVLTRRDGIFICKTSNN